MRAWYWPASPAAVAAMGRASRSCATAWDCWAARLGRARGVQRGLVEGDRPLDVLAGLAGQVGSVVAGASRQAAGDHRRGAHRHGGIAAREPAAGPGGEPRRRLERRHGHPSSHPGAASRR